jgi:hypothetical protein
MQKWEYREVLVVPKGSHGVEICDDFVAHRYVKDDDPTHTLEFSGLCLRYINKLGDEGWELVTTGQILGGYATVLQAQGMRYVLKRGKEAV